jgi:protein arginine N-methyltransferase 1
MYSVSSYGRMIADHVRTNAYIRALKQVLTPDSVVLDIGTGIGIFAMVACQLGVKRVYAVETDDAIELAREIANANGCSEQITFIHDLSNNITLPEPVDVIISDLHGVLPLCGRLIPSIADARKRLLAPGGVIIPRSETLWISLVDAPDSYAYHTVPWGDDVYGLEMKAAQRVVANTWRKLTFKPEQLLVPPKCWATLDYSTIENPNVTGDVTWTIERAGTAHGIAVWFDSALGEGIGFSNAPGEPVLIYGNAFFPLLYPLTLSESDVVSVRLSANLVDDDYVWRWDTQVRKANGKKSLSADFKQSTISGRPLSAQRLRKRASIHVPLLNEQGEIEKCVLALMDGKTSLDEIAQELTKRFPNRFATPSEALSVAGEVSLRFSK